MRLYGGNTLAYLEANAVTVPCPDVVIEALVSRVRELEGMLRDLISPDLIADIRSRKHPPDGLAYHIIQVWDRKLLQIDSALDGGTNP